jgi:hypothetical protein
MEWLAKKSQKSKKSSSAPGATKLNLVALKKDLFAFTQLCLQPNQTIPLLS